MDLIIIILVSFLLLVLSSIKSIFIAYPLGLSLLMLGFLAVKRGHKINCVASMALNGGKKALIVLKIFVLIGAIISAWMAAGTVPAIVYYGIKFLNPKFFVLSAFLISSLISFLIGTSFGTIGTVGIALMIMARGSGIDVNMAAGAIIAGAYFGDRCSPMSSSANLVASITNTDLYKNIKNMFKTSFIPLVLSIGLYLILSLSTPLSSSEVNLDREILEAFDVNVVVLLPAVIILVLSAFKVEVKILMLVSIVVACLISLLVQYESLKNLIRYLIFGFVLEDSTPLKTILKGGGILSMLKLAVVVFISSAFSGVFEGAGFLNKFEMFFTRAKKRYELMLLTIFASIVTAAFGCTQTIAIILGHQLVKKAYEEGSTDKSELAVDLENTAVVISPLIPWNIAGLIPAATLMVGSGYIVYSFYLYLIPLCNLLYYMVYRLDYKINDCM
jgi:Na+:H+ antiporter, NhaC family